MSIVLISRNSVTNVCIKKFFMKFYRYFHGFEKFALKAPIENKVRRPKKDPKINRYVQNVSKTDKMVLHYFPG